MRHKEVSIEFVGDSSRMPDKQPKISFATWPEEGLASSWPETQDGRKLTVMILLWDVGDPPSESFRFPSLSIVAEGEILKAVRRVVR